MQRARDQSLMLAQRACILGLARFGDREGLLELAEQVGGGGIRGLRPQANVVGSSLRILIRITGRNYGEDSAAWKRYLREEWQPDFLYFRQSGGKQEEKEGR